MRSLLLLLFFSCGVCFSQKKQPHVNAHSHNDYEQLHPLTDALQNGFNSVEADVHLQNGSLLVSHNHPGKDALSLDKLYLQPLDSLLKNSKTIYDGSAIPFYLMIDVKTEAEATYKAIRQAVKNYPSLLCVSPGSCPVKIFLSGNRAIDTMIKDGYSGIGLDGRPDDVGKNYSVEMMPVISDHYKNWSNWNGKSAPTTEDLQRISDLAKRIHAEGKKFRLWAIPDNETTWAALLNAGVDFINTDRLKELNDFLSKRGL